MSVVALVIFVLVAVLVLWFTKWLLGTAQVPEPAARIILVVVGLIILLVFLQRIGLLSGGGPMVRF